MTSIEGTDSTRATQQKSMNTLKSSPLMTEWCGIEAWRERRPDLDRELVGTGESEAVCLVALLQHYDFIVYLGYSFWRKVSFQITTLGNQEFDVKKLFEEGPLQWGAFGYLSKINKVLPAKYLLERCPIQEDLGAEDPTIVESFCLFFGGVGLNHHVDCLHAILENFDVADAFLSLVLMFCQSEGIVRRLLAQGIAIPWDAMGTAVASNNLTAVRMFLGHRARGTVRGAMNQNTNITDNDGDVTLASPGNKTVLYIAADNGHEQMVSLLLREGNVLDKIDVDARDIGQSTALHRAVWGNFLQVAELLLTEGCASVDIVDSINDTALHIAVRNRGLEMVALLLRHRACTHAVNGYGQTPLHLAAEANDATVARLLIESSNGNISAPLNDAGGEGGTREVSPTAAGGSSAASSRSSFVRMMTQKDSGGRTAYQTASHHNSQETANLIKARWDPHKKSGNDKKECACM